MFYFKKTIKPLLKGKKQIAGRNNQGRITSRHRGGGFKQKHRLIDFKRKLNQQAIVCGLFYDPNRTSQIALIASFEVNQELTFRFILATQGIKMGDIVKTFHPSFFKYNFPSYLKDGFCIPLSKFPQGSLLHCIEAKPGKGFRFIRSAGCSGRIVFKNLDYVDIELPSKKIKRFSSQCRAISGSLSNSTHFLKKFRKAGQKRWIGRRPRVRGVAINPVDHPHGGGEGKGNVGRPSVSPWGKLTKRKIFSRK